MSEIQPQQSAITRFAGQTFVHRPHFRSESADATGSSVARTFAHEALNLYLAFQHDNLPLDQFNAALLGLLKTSLSATGTSVLSQGREGEWSFDSNELDLGKPWLEEVSPQLNKLRLQSPRVEFHPQTDSPRTHVIIMIPGEPNSALVLPISPDVDRQSTKEVCLIAARLIDEKKRSQLDRNASSVKQQLAETIELLQGVNSCSNGKESAVWLVNKLATEKPFDLVAIAFQGRAFHLVAVSGSAKLDATSDINRGIEAAISESILRGSTTAYPPTLESGDHLLLAHNQLNQRLGTRWIASAPLTTEQGETIGGWLFAGSKKPANLLNWLTAVSPEIAQSIHLVEQKKPTALKQLFSYVSKSSNLATGLLMVLAILTVCFGLFYQVDYRIRAAAKIEPTKRSFSVAPFDGIIESNPFSTGDLIKKGETLLTLDGSAIRLDLAENDAKKRKALRQSDIELASDQIAQSHLKDLEYAILVAEESKLKYQQSKLRLVSPMDGVILNCSCENSVSKSVKKGEILFELGPISPVKIQVDIPADQVGLASPGDEVVIWIDGRPDSVPGVLTKIAPRASIRDSANVFVGEIEIENQDDRLLPGMEGTAYIKGPRRAVGWCLFRKPLQFIYQKMFGWW